MSLPSIPPLRGRTKMIHARRAKGLNQGELGHLVDCTQGAICRIEKGEVVPGGDRLLAIADALDITPADVLHVETGKPSKPGTRRSTPKGRSGGHPVPEVAPRKAAGDRR